MDKADSDIRELEQHDGASAMEHALQAEREKWLSVVAEKDAALAKQAAALAEKDAALAEQAAALAELAPLIAELRARMEGG